MKNITITANTSIREAMELLDQTGQKCLIVLDKNGLLIGTLTDGDIRRTVLSNKNFSSSIKSSFNPKPFFLVDGRFTNESAKTLLIDEKLDLLPIVNKDNFLIDYLTWGTFASSKVSAERSPSNMQVVIMAGGKGSRLKPFTNILPKPLVPIKDKTIIEHIIDKFTALGCNNFYITANYKRKILKSYFEDINHDYQLSFVNENKPLGTAGSIKLAQKNLNSSFFVTNCDIIINTNLKKIAQFHQDGKFDLTIVAAAKKHIIPYGTCEINSDGSFLEINEKPSLDFLINTGLYILESSILSLIPSNRFYHMTDLIRDAKVNKKKVGVFPIENKDWIDIGQWSEYKNYMNDIIEDI
jgi:dTDP-glucose pyrophosphorylase